MRLIWMDMSVMHPEYILDGVMSHLCHFLFLLLPLHNPNAGNELVLNIQHSFRLLAFIFQRILDHNGLASPSRARFLCHLAAPRGRGRRR